MVKTTRIVFNPEDIIAVRAQCANCQGEVALSRKVPGRVLPQFCPWCNAMWVQGRPETDVTRSFFELLKLLPDQNGSVRLSFELDAETQGGDQ